MRKISILLAATVLFIGACSKKDMYRNTAQVTGYDTRTCDCCGGFMIKITDDDKGENYTAKTLPDNVGINQYSTFPINVEVDYTKDDKGCDAVINVSRVRKL
jgi:hypothetical protein